MEQDGTHKKNKTVLKNGRIVTMNPAGDVVQADLFIHSGKIAKIGKISETDADVIDCSGLLILPGFVQMHVHLCQTLFRGRADDLELLDWLQKRVWPYEAALDAEAMRASAKLGIAELIKGGTTCILDMGSVRHYDVVFDELAQSGLRAFGGKCMMDHPETVPDTLRENCDESLAESEWLGQTWDGYDHQRLRYAVTPRFAISCTDELLIDSSKLARDHGYLLHTHSSENRDEMSLIARRAGCGNVEFLHRLGLTGPDVILAHCIWLNSAEKRLMEETHTGEAHCPSSNLKLASGIAPVYDYLQHGVRVGLGADGAPCNNNLDMFVEMRLAALLQKARFGASALKAKDVLRMATRGGAEALNLGDQIGSLEVGKKADIIGILDETVSTVPMNDPYSQLVYASSSRDVMFNMVDGRLLMRNRDLLSVDEQQTIALAKSEIKRVLDRMQA